MIALDSNVFIYHLGQHPEFGPAAKELLKAIENGQVVAVASEITFAEVLGFSGMTDKQAAIAEREIMNSNIKLMKVTTDTLLLAASLRRNYNLRTPDAIHIAAGLQAGAAHFVSNDRKLLAQTKTIPDIKVVPLPDIKNQLLAES